jgi:hypothetical protein
MAEKAPFYQENDSAGVRMPFATRIAVDVQMQHAEQTGMALIC